MLNTLVYITKYNGNDLIVTKVMTRYTPVSGSGLQDT